MSEVSVLRNQEQIDYFDSINPDVSALLKPKKIMIKDMDGEERHFVIHRIPALWTMAIADAFIQSSIPKISSPYEKEAVTRCMLRFVTIDVAGTMVNMDSCPSISDNHLGTGFDVLQQLLNEIIKYNTNFFPDGVPSVYEIVMERLTESVLFAAGMTLSDS